MCYFFISLKVVCQHACSCISPEDGKAWQVGSNDCGFLIVLLNNVHGTNNLPHINTSRIIRQYLCKKFANFLCIIRKVFRLNDHCYAGQVCRDLQFRLVGFCVPVRSVIIRKGNRPLGHFSSLLALSPYVCKVKKAVNFLQF